MTHKKTIFSRIMRGTVAATCCALAINASAFPATKYASNSVLAQGKWVKVAIPADGVYEITEQELHEMGFADINNVQVYGQGGHMIKEQLDGTAADDLNQVATMVTAGKLIFYANGPVRFTLTPAAGTTPTHFTRIINAYSTMGYYFLTEGKSPLTVAKAAETALGKTMLTTSYDYYYHESDMFSFGLSGKDMLGEDITQGGNHSFTLENPASGDMAVKIAAGAKVKSGSVYLRATFNAGGASVNAPFVSTASKINAPTAGNAYNYYNACAPVASLSLPEPAASGSINLNFGATADYTGAMATTVTKGALDNIIITYQHNNVIGNNSQTRMAFEPVTDNDVIALPGAPSAAVVWNIDNPNTPSQANLTSSDEGMGFSPGTINAVSKWVAFNPEGTLMKIAGHEAVDNQDIHGMATPDMVIVANKAFIEQAQRIADLHKNTDGLNVAVLDQQQVFNEFSSGTPDAMGVRLMCKMFYDRSNTKFKYLLMMGEGSYDNRGLASKKDFRVITYQTDVSNDEDYSYPCDDFFAMLDDNTGTKATSISSSTIKLGVGRFPSSSVEEATSDVDKLIKYVLTPDYGPWRNSTFYMAETGDKDLHITQAEGIANLMEKNIKTGMEINKVYVDMFPRAVNEPQIPSEANRTSSEARRSFIELLKRGQYYGTYVGHATVKTFTNSRLWRTEDALSTTYPHLPIVFTACCNVARYDSDTRGIAEHMFHSPNGGGIAMITTTREVYANSNDLLNQYFSKAMFNWQANGIPTLGYAMMKAKQGFGTANNANKLKFVLLGDPAMQLAYPVPLMRITEVNGTPVDNEEVTVETAPMQQVTVTAQVYNELGTPDNNFNGDATLTIYDYERKIPLTVTTQTVNYPRDILTQVTGRVVNGVFHGSAVLPRYIRGMGNNGMIRIYAHKDNTDKMVNAQFNNLMLNQYSATSALTDDNAPVITSMFLNEEETFNDGCTVAPNSTLYIHATDDLAFNNQSTSMGNSMRLVLDGGKQSYYDITENATITQDGKQLTVAYPLNGLSEGVHSLAYTVHDVAGNSASRTISFFVGNTSNININVNELPATTQATITAAATSNMPAMNVYVTDLMGNLVYTAASTAMPFTWNLQDMNGKRVKAGVYKVWGNYNDNGTNGGTNVASVIVLDPVK